MEESIELADQIKEKLNLKEIDANLLSPLVLAYIGDAIYEVVIRTKIISDTDTTVNKLHLMSTKLVKAHAQAEIVKSLELTEEEEKIYKRGRNAKSYTKAKNATLQDYRNATGFEALMGYLYLGGRTERMLEIINEGLKKYTDKIKPYLSD